MMNPLRPLSPHLPRFRKFLYSFFLLPSIVLFFYLLCLKMGFLAHFSSALSKAGLYFGGRALSSFLMKIGCSGLVLQ